MKLALIGGIGRLAPYYEREVKKQGHELRIFNSTEPGLAKKSAQATPSFCAPGKCHIASADKP